MNMTTHPYLKPRLRMTELELYLYSSIRLDGVHGITLRKKGKGKVQPITGHEGPDGE
jgi:hypothetical protein